MYFEIAAGDPYRIAALNLMLFATLVFAVVACVGVFRRLPAAYGTWVAVSLALPLDLPGWPAAADVAAALRGVLFPIFMWLALWSEERRATERVAALSALGPRPVHGAVRQLALDLVRRAQAVLLDALGTLVELQPPAPRLRRLLADAGFELYRGARRRGLRRRDRVLPRASPGGADRASLDDLRDRCAGVLRAALGLPGLDHATARRAMLEALEFRAFPGRGARACGSCANAGWGSWW